MAFWEKLSCQWLHCLSRIVVINFTRTWSTAVLFWRRGIWAAELGPLFTLFEQTNFVHTRGGRKDGEVTGSVMKIRQ